MRYLLSTFTKRKTSSQYPHGKFNILESTGEKISNRTQLHKLIGLVNTITADAPHISHMSNLHLLSNMNTSHRYRGVILVAQEVVNKPGARVAVSSNCHTLVHAIGVTSNNIVELVRHTTTLRHISHTSRPVELHDERERSFGMFLLLNH